MKDIFIRFNDNKNKYNNGTFRIIEIVYLSCKKIILDLQIKEKSRLIRTLE